MALHLLKPALVWLLAVVALARPAAAHPCLDELGELEVPYRSHAPLLGVEIPVEVTGPMGGVMYHSYLARPLVLDCSLVLSLARAASVFTAAGISAVRFSSAYQRRNIRGTNRPSRHGRGLALDVHELRGDEIGVLTIEDDFEQGLGDDADCVGAPASAAGATLRTLYCRLISSGLFRLVLSPDTDADHYNHFHLEALPWAERGEQ